MASKQEWLLHVVQHTLEQIIAWKTGSLADECSEEDEQGWVYEDTGSYFIATAPQIGDSHGFAHVRKLTSVEATPGKPKYQAILHDRTVHINATFSKDAIEKYTQDHAHPVERVQSSFIDIKAFQIIVTNEGPDTWWISLLIKDFFRNPDRKFSEANIPMSMETVYKYQLKHLQTEIDLILSPKKAGAHDETASVDKAKSTSSGKKRKSVGTDSEPITQTTFATQQAPALSPSREDDAHQGGKAMVAEEPTIASVGEQMPHHAASKAQFKPKARALDVLLQRQKKAEIKVSGPSSTIESRQAGVSREAVSVQDESETADAPLATEPESDQPKEQTTREEPSPKSNHEDPYVQTKDSNDVRQRSRKRKRGREQVRYRDVFITKAQEELLNSPDSWYPYTSGQPDKQENTTRVPLAILQQLNHQADLGILQTARDNSHSESADDLSERLQSPSAQSQSALSSTNWPASPDRNALPPDSSPEHLRGDVTRQRDNESEQDPDDDALHPSLPGCAPTPTVQPSVDLETIVEPEVDAEPSVSPPDHLEQPLQRSSPAGAEQFHSSNSFASENDESPLSDAPPSSRISPVPAKEVLAPGQLDQRKNESCSRPTKIAVVIETPKVAKQSEKTSTTTSSKGFVRASDLLKKTPLVQVKNSPIVPVSVRIPNSSTESETVISSSLNIQLLAESIVPLHEGQPTYPNEEPSGEEPIRHQSQDADKPPLDCERDLEIAYTVASKRPELQSEVASNAAMSESLPPCKRGGERDGPASKRRRRNPIPLSLTTVEVLDEAPDPAISARLHRREWLSARRDSGSNISRPSSVAGKTGRGSAGSDGQVGEPALENHFAKGLEPGKRSASKGALSTSQNPLTRDRYEDFDRAPSELPKSSVPAHEADNPPISAQHQAREEPTTRSEMSKRRRSSASAMTSRRRDSVRTHTPFQPGKEASDRDQESTTIDFSSQTARMLFDEFKATYSDYTGDLTHFTKFCRKLKKMALYGPLHPSLWDDFVARHIQDYSKYCSAYTAQCIEAGDEPIDVPSYQVYFHRNVDGPRYDKRILNLESIMQVTGNDVPDLSNVGSQMQTPVATSEKLPTPTLTEITSLIAKRNKGPRQSSAASIVLEQVSSPSAYQPALPRPFSSTQILPSSSIGKHSAGTPVKSSNIGSSSHGQADPLVATKEKARRVLPWLDTGSSSSMALPASVSKCTSSRNDRCRDTLQAVVKSTGSPAPPRRAPSRTDHVPSHRNPVQPATRPLASSPPPIVERPQASRRPGTTTQLSSKSAQDIISVSSSSQSRPEEPARPKPTTSRHERVTHEEQWWQDPNTPFKVFARQYLAIRPGKGNSYARQDVSEPEPRRAGQARRRLGNLDIEGWNF